VWLTPLSSEETLEALPGPEVDVMITIFYDFSQFSEKKLAFLSKTYVMINF
jgi:hypothetical protein